MSWFSTESLKGFADGLAQKVQSNMDHNKMLLLEKLTLTTPELTAERQRIDAEELRKEAVRDALAGILPWETRDPDRDILVDECKEAILKLSSVQDTFYGPFPMPPKNVKTENDKDSETKPSAESIEKLEKLEPLPPLLKNFDLDYHVGLIQKLLKEDEKLVKMQSKHSGGGAREKIFWHNYFFHCAYARYEAGMSIDEIWSDQPNEKDNSEEEEEVDFEASEEKAFKTEPTVDANEPFEEQDKPSPTTDSNNTAEFELVDEGDGDIGVMDDDDEINPDDYELDELEAEIARELED